MKRSKKRRSGVRAQPRGKESPLLVTARSYLREGRADFARMVLERAVAAEPEVLELRLALLQALAALREWAACQQQCERVLSASPLQAEAWITLAQALLEQGRHEAAVAQLGGLDAVHPCAEQLLRLGTLCLEHGHLAEAREALERAFSLQPELPGLALTLSRVVRFDDTERPLVHRMHALLDTFSAEPLLRADVNFALGKAYEDLGDYPRSAAHFIDANSQVAGTVRFDADEHARAVDAIIESFGEPLLRRLAGSGDPSRRPVFIVGMPRSGTTLVEQVLAAHPQVAAGGECQFLDQAARGLRRQMGASLPYPGCVAGMGAADVQSVSARYLEGLTGVNGEAARVTDKMPTNFLHLGLVAACLPGAQIIHCTRDALDTAVSLYVQQFSSGNDWTYRADDIAAFHAQYERLMAHWRGLSDGAHGEPCLRLFEIAYEDLVSDPQIWVRALLGFVGVDFDPRCLSPHRGRSVVRTASNWQVRQPINARSVGRSARFAAYLPELVSAMAARSG